EGARVERVAVQVQAGVEQVVVAHRAHAAQIHGFPAGTAHVGQGAGLVAAGSFGGGRGGVPRDVVPEIEATGNGGPFPAAVEMAVQLHAGQDVGLVGRVGGQAAGGQGPGLAVDPHRATRDGAPVTVAQERAGVVVGAVLPRTQRETCLQVVGDG